MWILKLGILEKGTLFQQVHICWAPLGGPCNRVNLVPGWFRNFAKSRPGNPGIKNSWSCRGLVTADSLATAWQWHFHSLAAAWNYLVTSLNMHAFVACCSCLGAGRKREEFLLLLSTQGLPPLPKKKCPTVHVWNFLAVLAGLCMYRYTRYTIPTYITDSLIFIGRQYDHCLALSVTKSLRQSFCWGLTDVTWRMRILNLSRFSN